MVCVLQGDNAMKLFTTSRFAGPIGRGGFTLVELLVTIAIIGILTAFAVPAVQAMREGTRRNQCTHQMSRLILGVHQYELAFNRYPVGTTDDAVRIENDDFGNHHNWITRTLPYIDEPLAYRNVRQDLSVYDAENRATRLHPLRVLQCPSDINFEVTYPSTSYAGVHHGAETPIAEDNNGVFVLNRRIGYDDVTDGIGNTFFIGEKVYEDDLGWMSGTRATLRNTGGYVGAAPIHVKLVSQQPTQPERSIQAVLPSTVPGENTEKKRASEVTKSDYEFDEKELRAQFGGSDESVLVPGREKSGNGTAPSVSSAAFPAPTSTVFVGGFSSRHVGGINFAFGDGSIEMISPQIDARVYSLLGSRNDGVLIPSRE
jgi:prepilin-type N-terminal cleavage/methylation domain-containing protein/prepilin-type processing-associated H-X9-DG protein